MERLHGFLVMAAAAGADDDDDDDDGDDDDERLHVRDYGRRASPRRDSPCLSAAGSWPEVDPAAVVLSLYMGGSPDLSNL